MRTATLAAMLCASPTLAAQELFPHPEREDCVVYTNVWTGKDEPDVKVWFSPLGPVAFKFYRGDGYEVDQVIVWELPEGTAVLPYTVTLEEKDNAEFCIAWQKEMG